MRVNLSNRPKLPSAFDTNRVEMPRVLREGETILAEHFEPAAGRIPIVEPRRKRWAKQWKPTRVIVITPPPQKKRPHKPTPAQRRSTRAKQDMRRRVEALASDPVPDPSLKAPWED